MALTLLKPRRTIMLVMLALSSATCSLVSQAASFKLDSKPKIAFIYAATARDGGWNESLDNARLKVEEKLDIKIPFAENIPEDATALNTVIDQYVQQGFNIIVGTTYGYSDGILEAAKKYPKVAFLNASGTTNADNLESFYARTYQGWYLAGMVSAYESEGGPLGMIAGFPVNVVEWDINAYARGAQAVDPDIKISVIFTNSWWDPEKEGQAAQTLLDQGAVIIANNLSSSAPFTATEKAGAGSIGFQLDMSTAAPTGNLTSVIFYWEKYLIPAIQKIMTGTWRPNPNGAFPGISQGVVDIKPLYKSPLQLHKSIAREDISNIARAEAGMIIGKLTPFDGPLYSQDGKLQAAQGQSLSDDQLWEMNYLVKGIKGDTR